MLVQVRQLLPGLRPVEVLSLDRDVFEVGGGLCRRCGVQVLSGDVLTFLDLVVVDVGRHHSEDSFAVLVDKVEVAPFVGGDAATFDVADQYGAFAIDEVVMVIPADLIGNDLVHITDIQMIERPVVVDVGWVLQSSNKPIDSLRVSCQAPVRVSFHMCFFHLDVVDRASVWVAHEQVNFVNVIDDPLCTLFDMLRHVFSIMSCMPRRIHLTVTIVLRFREHEGRGSEKHLLCERVHFQLR